jgi:hypothetical protein
MLLWIDDGYSGQVNAWGFSFYDKDEMVFAHQLVGQLVVEQSQEQEFSKLIN